MADSRRILFIFPGQGSQYPGMGSDLVEEFKPAREVFARASEVAGYDMEELWLRGSAPTAGLHPLYATGDTHTRSGLLQSLLSLVPDIRPAMAAGHSLGEYTALVTGGALSFEDALRLVIRRAELMYEHGQGRMLATALDLGQARALADKHFCGIGGCNLPEQTVIAGSERGPRPAVGGHGRQISAQTGRAPEDRGCVPHLPDGGRGAALPGSSRGGELQTALRRRLCQLHRRTPRIR